MRLRRSLHNILSPLFTCKIQQEQPSSWEENVSAPLHTSLSSSSTSMKTTPSTASTLSTSTRVSIERLAVRLLVCVYIYMCVCVYAKCVFSPLYLKNFQNWLPSLPLPPSSNNEQCSGDASSPETRVCLETCVCFQPTFLLGQALLRIIRWFQ